MAGISPAMTTAGYWHTPLRAVVPAGHTQVLPRNVPPLQPDAAVGALSSSSTQAPDASMVPVAQERVTSSTMARGCATTTSTQRPFSRVTTQECPTKVGCLKAVARRQVADEFARAAGVDREHAAQVARAVAEGDFGRAIAGRGAQCAQRRTGLRICHARRADKHQGAADDRAAPASMHSRPRLKSARRC